MRIHKNTPEVSQPIKKQGVFSKVQNNAGPNELFRIDVEFEDGKSMEIVASDGIDEMDRIVEIHLYDEDGGWIYTPYDHDYIPVGDALKHATEDDVGHIIWDIVKDISILHDDKTYAPKKP